MKDALHKLKEFHKRFACASAEKPYVVDGETRKLRADLMTEELNETLAAMEAGDLEAIADGLADLCYVAIGTAVAYGIPLDAVFAEVHRANMSKASICASCSGTGKFHNQTHRYSPVDFTPCSICSGTGSVVLYREDGKVLKPEGWQPPDIAAALQR